MAGAESEDDVVMNSDIEDPAPAEGGEEEVEEEEFEVETVLRAVRQEDDTWSYFTKWVGYHNEEDNTWVAATDMGADELVAEFWSSHGYTEGPPQDLRIKKVPPSRKLKTSSKSASAKSASSSAPVASGNKRKGVDKSSKKEKESASASVSVDGASASEEDDEDEAEKPAKKKSKNVSNGRKSKKDKKTDHEKYDQVDFAELPKDLVKFASWEDKVSDILTVEENPQGGHEVIFHIHGSEERYAESSDVFIAKAPKLLSKFFLQHLKWREQSV